MAYPSHISLNEFMPDPASDWDGNGVADRNDEYIELYNANDHAVDLSGWLLDDVDDQAVLYFYGPAGSQPYALPPGTVIAAGGFLVVYRSQTGVALNNDGDWVRLLRPDGVVVEQVEYSSSRDDEPYSKTVDGGTQWTRGYPPSPGSTNTPAGTPTPTPTATASPTPSTASLQGWVFEDADADGRYEPWAGETGIAGVLIMLSDGRSKLTGPTGFYGWHNLVPGNYTVRQAQPLHTSSTTPDELTVTLAAGDNRDDVDFGEVFLPPDQVRSLVLLNEFLPAPHDIDWDGNGVADAEDEWVELYNASEQPVDLSGWFLDDVDDSLQAVDPDGSQPYLLPRGTLIAAHGFLLLYRSQTGVALNNSGDQVRLLGPGRFELESFAFAVTAYDVSWSKTVDGGDQWTDSYPPSPGTANLPGSTATPTLAGTPTPTPTATATPAVYPTAISLNEFMPDPASDWDGNGVADLEDEYIELYNANDFPVDLSGWLLDDVNDGGAAVKATGPDGSRPYPLPPGTVIPARGFLVFFRSQTGVALNNDGDQVRLLRPDGVVVEEAAYSSSRDDEAYSKTVDGGTTWTRSYKPSPGSTNTPAGTPTPTLTASPTATPTPLLSRTPTSTPTPTPAVYPGGISLNEFMPDPASDWDGNGVADLRDEYIELYNANDHAVDLSGWLLDDIDDESVLYFHGPAGSPPYPLPPGTIIPAGGFLVFYRSQTAVALNNDGDWVRLLRPDGVVVEQIEYSSSRDDEPYSKTVDGGTEWTRSYLPSPGDTNTPAGTPTPTPTASPAATPTPPRTPTPFPTGVSLNEFLPHPQSKDWNGDGQVDPGDEYIELYNANDRAVDLSGWLLDDVDDGLASPNGSRPYAIPPGTSIEAHGLLVFFRSQTGLVLNDSGGDSVRLLWPDAAEVERYDYTETAPDRAYSKLEAGGNVWTTGYPPSPGAPNRPAYTAEDVIRLNEVLPSPRDTDWDGDGQAGYLDEWIELVNAGQTTVDLGGWKLADGPPPAGAGLRSASRWTYELPEGTLLAPGDFLVIFRRQSGLALDPSEEWVRLLYPDDVQADLLTMDRFSGYDQSWCRLPDGVGAWTLACAETPGRANLPGSGGESGGSGGWSAPPYDRFDHDLVSVAQARTLPDGTLVTIEGQITVLPGLLGDRQAYIQDATGGILVYLRSAEWPRLSEGQWVRVNGPLDTYKGEREVRLTRIDDVKTQGPGVPPAPVLVASGQVGEALEGRLIQLSAAVSGYWGDTTLYLDDGSGEARVIVRQETGMKRPYVTIGDVWTVVGVVSQWDDEPPYDSGYRIFPRRPADLQPGVMTANPATRATDAGLLSAEAAALGPPRFLPVTGQAGE